ncbi:hypothetical protein Tco_0360954 [Tanacetum coccineum]
MENKKNMSLINEDNMPILDEVVFKIHKNSYFEFDPLSTMIKRKCGKTNKEGRIKKVKSGMVDDEPVVRKSIKTSRKGKEKMYDEFPPVEDVGLVQEKADAGNKEGVRIRSNVLGLMGHVNKLKKPMISATKELFEWAEQQAGTPYLRTPPLKPRRKGIEFPCLSVDGYIDVVGSSKCCDLVHESIGYNGHSLPNMDKECFSNDVVLDVVVPDTLAYTLPLLLKKCRSKVSVTRKRSCLNSSKITSLRKGSGKRVGCGAKNQRWGSLTGLNVQAGDDDLQVTPQEEKTTGSSITGVKNYQ